MKTLHVITIFPEYFEVLRNTGVVGSFLRGERGSSISIKFYNPSDYGPKGFKGVDGAPYGGGAGQVMRADILENTLLEGVCSDSQLNQEAVKSNYKVIYLGPRGKRFNQDIAKDIASELQEGERELVFLCGRYEGVDERFIEKYVEEHLSLGDFVLSGGEVALNAILDASLRLIPGVLGNNDSPIEESFDGNGIEFPQYTKPQMACNREVPEVLLSGHHKNIKKWRQQKRAEYTLSYRPDLLEEE